MEEDEIDLVELAAHFWGDRYIIGKITAVVVLVGLFIALFSSVEYQTDAELLPVMMSQNSKAENLLNQYGGLLGISGGGMQMGSGSQNLLPPQLYPQIVESLPFQMEVMNTPIHFAEYDTTATSYEFFQDIYSPSVLSYVKAYTLGLPGLVIGLFKGGDETDMQRRSRLNVAEPDSVYNLSKAQWRIINQFRDRVTISVSQETGVVTLDVEMPDAQAAAELGQAAMQALKKYVRDYRTRSAQKDLEFIQKQANSAGKEFEKAQQKLANFRDSNIDLTSARSRSHEQELQSEYDLAFNTYNSLRQQLEQAKLKVQEQTPVFYVLQPVTVPSEKSSPKRMLILIVSIILGFILGLGWSLARGWGGDIVKEIKSGDRPADREG